jgi:hypothetical protein
VQVQNGLDQVSAEFSLSRELVRRRHALVARHSSLAACATGGATAAGPRRVRGHPSKPGPERASPRGGTDKCGKPGVLKGVVEVPAAYQPSDLRT